MTYSPEASDLYPDKIPKKLLLYYIILYYIILYYIILYYIILYYIILYYIILYYIILYYIILYYIILLLFCQFVHTDKLYCMIAIGAVIIQKQIV